MYPQNKDSKRLATIAVILVVAIVSTIPAAAGTKVSVDAPKYVSVDETFSVIINIDDVENLDSGEFSIYFNSKVINVVNVADDGCASAIKSGIVGGTKIPIDGCGILSYSASFAGDSKLQVLFNINGVAGTSGSGRLMTITFEVAGKSGDYSVLDFSRDDTPPLLTDTKSKKISATWIGGGVTIGTSEPDPKPTPNSTATATAIQTSTYTTKYETTVYVYNRDDDRLDVHLLINGEDRGHQEITSGGTSKTYNQDPFETTDFKFEAGVHTFTIRWFDKDTKEWYEKTEKHHITEATTVILQTDEHTKDEDKISAHVYIKNLDDDSPNVYLYIDGNYKKYMSISSNSTGDYGEHDFEDDDDDSLHSFKIEWHDPGIGEDYEKITRSHITGEEAVTLYVDKHTKEDRILLPDETPTPVSTRSASTETSTRSASDSQPSTRNTPSGTTFHTDPILPENSAETNGSGQGITWYSLIGLIAAVFALLQIRRS